MAVYRPRLTSADINAMITADTVNNHVTADTVNNHVTADTVNGHISSQKVNSLVDLDSLSIPADQVIEIIKGIDAGDVSSYALAWLKTDGKKAAPGVVVDGSELRFASTYNTDDESGHGGSGVSMQGKWRCMGYCGGAMEAESSSRHARTTLWKRVE